MMGMTTGSLMGLLISSRTCSIVTLELSLGNRYETRTILVDSPTYRGRYRSRPIYRSSDMGAVVMLLVFVVCFVLTSILCEVLR